MVALASPAEVLPVAAAAGELLLRCGAEVSRVEDTVARIARAYDIQDAETFATPTGLFISLGADRRVTVVKRVTRRSVALDIVSAINALSRDLVANPIAPGEALERIQAIATRPNPFPAHTDVLFSGLAAAACTMLVGGVLSDFFPALLANIVVQRVQRIAGDWSLPESLGDFLAGAVAVGAALGLSHLVGSSVGPVVAGGIMVLVPGIAFTAAVRDAMAGDLVSAGARGLEASMKAAALASGVATALYMAGGAQL